MLGEVVQMDLVEFQIAFTGTCDTLPTSLYYRKSTHFGNTTHKRMVPCELSNINWVSPPDFLVPG